MPYLFVLPPLILLAVFVYGPAFENVIFSLHSWSSINPDWEFVGLRNYRQLFANPVFWVSLSNNTLYAVISVIVQVFVALGIAAVLSAGIFRPRLNTFFRTSVFLPAILPVTVVGLLWQLIYQPSIGLIDQFLFSTGLGNLSRVWLGEEQTAIYAIILVSQWQWTGYMVALFMVAIAAIPTDLYEALEMEGATRIQQFRYVTLPGVRESTLIFTVITIFGAFKVFDIVWVMTAGGPNRASEVLGTHMYRSAFRDDVVGYSSAVATVIFVITICVGIVQLMLQRDE
ncbi:sugar ABC transporter permease [uncultured Hoeflea sp.]|uniref:carbohydrate ABC transporter permease n=1 Tax=uncultured Hoeflea sp. TaxID=538666 RepID=UPI00260BBBFA|nr:sugar ABC transporter permease [uncultured Hoeflea sp.]